MTAQKYERPPEVAAEFASLPAEGDPEYLDRLRAGKLEVLVIARRQTKDAANRDRLDELIVECVMPRIRAAVARHSRAPFAELDEVEDEAMVMFWEQIQEESFFEVRFNLAMKTLAQHAGRRMRGGKQRQRERFADRIESTAGAAGEAPLDVADDTDAYRALENEILIRGGLATLPEDQALALTLHYLMERPIYSKDPGTSTVASALGYGERKTRQLVSDGRAALKRWIDQEESDD